MGAPMDNERMLCSRCEEILDTSGSPKWCRKCRAKYQREYQLLRMEMASSGGFIKGREAMRQIIVAEFDKLASGKFSGCEIADLVAQMPGPQVTDEEPEKIAS